MKKAPERKPVAYGYSRVSTSKQVDTGCSLEVQSSEHARYFKARLESQGVLWGGTFADPETSGGVRILDRKAGRELCLRLQPGDHVLVTELSRAWRKFSDMVATMEGWCDRGINFHIIRYGIDTTTEWGKLMCRLMGALAEMERQLARERTREAMRHRKREGKQINQHPGYGKKLVGQKGNLRPVEDRNELELMARIVSLRDEQGFSFDDIYFAFQKANIRTREDKAWSRTRIFRAYQAQKKRGSQDT